MCLAWCKAAKLLSQCSAMVVPALELSTSALSPACLSIKAHPRTAAQRLLSKWLAMSCGSNWWSGGFQFLFLNPRTSRPRLLKKQVGSNAKWKTADPEKLPFYKEWAEKQDAKRNAVDKHSASVQVTSDAIVHAITSQYPQTRYVVASVGKGIPAWIVTFLAWLLPDRLVDMAAVHFWDLWPHLNIYIDRVLYLYTCIHTHTHMCIMNINVYMYACLNINRCHATWM